MLQAKNLLVKKRLLKKLLTLHRGRRLCEMLARLIAAVVKRCYEPI